MLTKNLIDFFKDETVKRRFLSWGVSPSDTNKILVKEKIEKVLDAYHSKEEDTYDEGLFIELDYNPTTYYLIKTLNDFFRLENVLKQASRNIDVVLNGAVPRVIPVSLRMSISELDGMAKYVTSFIKETFDYMMHGKKVNLSVKASIVSGTNFVKRRFYIDKGVYKKTKHSINYFNKKLTTNPTTVDLDTEVVEVPIMYTVCLNETQEVFKFKVTFAVIMKIRAVTEYNYKLFTRMAIVPTNLPKRRTTIEETYTEITEEDAFYETREIISFANTILSSKIEIINEEE